MVTAGGDVVSSAVEPWRCYCESCDQIIFLLDTHVIIYVQHPFTSSNLYAIIWIYGWSCKAGADFYFFSRCFNAFLIFLNISIFSLFFLNFLKHFLLQSGITSQTAGGKRGSPLRERGIKNSRKNPVGSFLPWANQPHASKLALKDFECSEKGKYV